MSIFLLLILMTSNTITFTATANLSKITNTTTSTSGELFPPPSFETTRKSNTKELCKIPNTEGSLYFDDSENVTPDTMFEKHKIINENCRSGYHMIVYKAFLVCLENGQWLQSYSNKLCLRMCTPVISDSLDIRCTFEGEKVNCSEPSIPGTTLIPQCKSTHTVPNGSIETPINLHCQHDGTWNNKLYSCIPKCGVPFVPYIILIHNGTKTTTKSVPWSIAIYNKNELICGGTLIAPNLVVTAAHCFWVSELPGNAFRNNGSYKIAVGKFERDISIMEYEYTQIIDVEYVYMEPHYSGLNGYHANDIAVVVLSSHVAMSRNVMPICVDWYSVHGVKNGHIGKIAGWSTTGNGTKISHLLELYLSYIDIVTCRKRYEDGFERYLSNDKFCAGTESGQGIDLGDSGAGLTIKYNGRHFLVGVASIKDPEKRDSVAAFTNFKSHVEWIRGVYTNYTAITLT